MCRNVGKGYFLLKGDDKDTLNTALMVSPFRSKWGTCMLQSWVPGFNPNNPSNLAFPTWVSLRNLPHEHQDQAVGIAEALGEVIGMETENEYAKDPRFCVNLEISKGWATSIELVTEGGILPPQIVEIDYDKLPIRCRVCLSWRHKASECKDMQKRPGRGRERPAQNQPAHQQEKGKNIVLDQDGFQQVQHRRNIRRNIFEGNRDRGQHQHWRDNIVSHPHAFGVAAPAAAHNNLKKGGRNGDSSNAERRGPAGSGIRESTIDQGEQPHAASNGAEPTGSIAPGPVEAAGRVDGNNSGTGAEKERPMQESAREKMPEEGHQQGLAGKEGAIEGPPGERQGQEQSPSGEDGPTDLPKTSRERNTSEVNRVLTGAEEGSRGRATQELNELWVPEQWTSGTSGAGRGGEEHPDFETTMNWSPTKIAGQKRGLETLEEDRESLATSNEEGSEEGEQEEEEEEEWEEECGEEAEEESLRGGREGAKEMTQDRGAVGGTTRASDGVQHRVMAPGNPEEANSDLGPTDTGNPGQRSGSPPPRPEGDAAPGRGSHRRGPGITPEKRRNKTLVSATPQQDAAPAEYYSRGGKAQRLSELETSQVDVIMETEEGTILETEVIYASRPSLMEVIPETQPITLKGGGMVYKEILASIGLDSPTPSHETRENVLGKEQGTQQINTPIRNSAASLMALGTHVFTPRQGRLWEGRNKSPLGN